MLCIPPVRFGNGLSGAPGTPQVLWLWAQEVARGRRLSGGNDREPIAADRPGPLEAVGGQFYHGKCAQGSDDAPGPDSAPDLERPAVPGHEQEINRELHEERVHDIGRRQNQRVFSRKVTPSQETAVT